MEERNKNIILELVMSGIILLVFQNNIFLLYENLRDIFQTSPSATNLNKKAEANSLGSRCNKAYAVLYFKYDKPWTLTLSHF